MKKVKKSKLKSTNQNEEAIALFSVSLEALTTPNTTFELGAKQYDHYCEL